MPLYSLYQDHLDIFHLRSQREFPSCYVLWDCRQIFMNNEGMRWCIIHNVVSKDKDSITKQRTRSLSSFSCTSCNALSQWWDVIPETFPLPFAIIFTCGKHTGQWFIICLSQIAETGYTGWGARHIYSTRSLFYKGESDFQLVLSLKFYPNLTSLFPSLSLIFSWNDSLSIKFYPNLPKFD